MKNTHKTTLTKYLFLHSFSVYLTVLGALYEGLLLLRKHQHLLMFTRTLASPVLQVWSLLFTASMYDSEQETQNASKHGPPLFFIRRLLLLQSRVKVRHVNRSEMNLSLSLC